MTNSSFYQADFASLAAGTVVDGGGNQFSFDFTAPAWDTVSLSAFDLRPGYGVGARGGWAAAAPSATSYFSAASAPNGSSVTSYVNRSFLSAAIQSYSADTYFSDATNVNKVIVYYDHSDARQRKRIEHLFDGTNVVGTASWSQYAKDGTWSKNRIVAYDPDGAMRELPRSAIGSGEDLTHSDGTTYLNT